MPRYLRCGFCGLPRHETRADFMRCVRAAFQTGLTTAPDLHRVYFLEDHDDQTYRPRIPRKITAPFRNATPQEGDEGPETAQSRVARAPLEP